MGACFRKQRERPKQDNNEDAAGIDNKKNNKKRRWNKPNDKTNRCRCCASVDCSKHRCCLVDCCCLGSDDSEEYNCFGGLWDSVNCDLGDCDTGGCDLGDCI